MLLSGNNPAFLLVLLPGVKGLLGTDIQMNITVKALIAVLPDQFSVATLYTDEVLYFLMMYTPTEVVMHIQINEDSGCLHRVGFNKNTPTQIVPVLHVCNCSFQEIPRSAFLRLTFNIQSMESVFKICHFQALVFAGFPCQHFEIILTPLQLAYKIIDN